VYTLESRNIIYRQITEEDTDLILSWRNSDFVRQYYIYQPIITKEEHLNYYHNKCESGDIIQFIMSNKEDNTPFGCIYLKDVKDENNKAEYGVFIGDESYIGKGLGTEACMRITQFAFEELKLHKVYLRVIADNERAIKSYQKTGYRIEGNFEDDVIINGKYVSVVFMGIMNPKDK